ncbi:hypothetical protein KEM55_005563 [Ascosphaera atra]|nr:hypothetical protein KEM55_005563 [Ascosphaera atra]
MGTYSIKGAGQPGSSPFTSDAEIATKEITTSEPEVYGPSDSERDGRLKRGLKGRHISMIAIGGAVGTGLLIGTGSALASFAGPE